MEKWKEILSKCEKCRNNNFSCTKDGKLCENFQNCGIRAEYDVFLKSGFEEKKAVQVPTFCPIKYPLQLKCIKAECEWYVQLPEQYGRPMPAPCCAVVGLLEVFIQLRIAVEGIKHTMESKLT